MASTAEVIMSEGTDKRTESARAATGAGQSTIGKQAGNSGKGGPGEALVSRGSDDEINRFLFCAVVNRSSKHISARAEKGGGYLPMSVIVRSVLRSYRQAAKEQAGIFRGPKLDMPFLRDLNEKVLRDEITREGLRLKTSQDRLARANRPADEMRIKAGQEELERVMAAWRGPR
jgi:hypothetical protein